MVSVAFDELLLLLLARVDGELELVVVGVGREVQLDGTGLADEEPAALHFAAEEARIARVVQRRRAVVNLRVPRQQKRHLLLLLLLLHLVRRFLDISP